MKRTLGIILAFSLFVLFFSLSALANPPFGHDSTAGSRTISRALRIFGPGAEARIRPFFTRAGIAYPPRKVTLIALKEEMGIELWAEKQGKWVHVRNYDFLASGCEGPKQHKGDKQVPEGIYHVVELNPSSRFHLSMKLDYPNTFDLRKAREDRRANIGGDIYIHGNVKSCGCLAVGDRAIEELFVLAAKTGPENLKVIIAPRDIRKSSPAWFGPPNPSWLPELYETIGQELAKYRPKQGV